MNPLTMTTPQFIHQYLYLLSERTITFIRFFNMNSVMTGLILNRGTDKFIRFIMPLREKFTFIEPLGNGVSFRRREKTRDFMADSLLREPTDYLFAYMFSWKFRYLRKLQAENRRIRQDIKDELLQILTKQQYEDLLNPRAISLIAEDHYFMRMFEPCGKLNPNTLKVIPTIGEDKNYLKTKIRKVG